MSSRRELGLELRLRDQLAWRRRIAGRDFATRSTMGQGASTTSYARTVITTRTQSVAAARLQERRNLARPRPRAPTICANPAGRISGRSRNCSARRASPTSVNPRLVRGLDYYTRTTFEAISKAVGAQSAVVAGGRYDGLVEALGGAAVAGTGFAIGVERIALALETTLQTRGGTRCGDHRDGDRATVTAMDLASRCARTTCASRCSRLNAA